MAAGAVPAAWLCDCSPTLELSRPNPVDLSAYHSGMQRGAVLAKLGPPLASAPHAGHDCDFYKLTVSGAGMAGRAAIALGEAAAYVAIFGLSEAVITRAELAAHKGKKTVTFCYGAGGVLAGVAVKA